MNTILENLYITKELHSSIFSPVCSKYNLTLAEILVLLFLANNREYDSAKDIVKRLKIKKSHVSLSIRELEERGYLKGGYEGSNRRTIHLHLCDKSDGIIEDARDAQKKFLSILERGFSEEEVRHFNNYIRRVNENINDYLGTLI